MAETVTDEFGRMADDLIRREVAKPGFRDQDHAAWARLRSAAAEAGWFDVLLAEELGGLGLDTGTAAAIFTIIGRRLVPGPFIDHIVVIPRLYPYADATVRSRLDSARRGESTVVFIDAHATGQALPTLDGGRLTGKVDLARFATSAEAFLVVAFEREHGVVAVLVDPEADGIDVSPRESFDPSSTYADVRFDAVEVDPKQVLQSIPASDFTEEVARLRDTIRVMISVELAGLSRHLLDESVAYAKYREQFGRPIGAFQPVQQILAQMATSVLALEAFVTQCAHHNGESAESSELVKGFAAEIARQVGENALQVHGGIAFTAEFELNKWFLHGLALQDLYGDEAAIYQKVGRALLRGEPAH